MNDGCGTNFSIVMIIPGKSKRKRPAFDKIVLPECHSNALKTVMFYSRYVRYGSVIYPSLIGHYLPTKWEIFCRKRLREPVKTSENAKENSPLFFFLATMTLECVRVFCPLGRMESP